MLGAFQDDIGINIEFGFIEADSTNKNADSIYWINFHHLKHMYNISKRLKGLHKLKVIYKSPGWLPEHEYDEKGLSPKASTNNNSTTSKLTASPQPNQEVKKTNSILSYIMCLFSIYEPFLGAFILLSMNMLKNEFSNMDFYKLLVTIFSIQTYCSTILMERNNDKSIIINDHKSNKLRISFCQTYPVFSMVQILRLLFNIVFYYSYFNHYSNTINSNSAGFYIFFYLSIGSAFQLLTWVVSINYSHYNIKLNTNKKEN